MSTNSVSNDLSPISQLRALARGEKRPVRSVNMYDPDICVEFNLADALHNAEPPPDWLRKELRVSFADRRFVIRANDRYLAIEVRGDFATNMFSINRPSRFMAFFYGEMRKSFSLGSHPVFVLRNDVDPRVLHHPEVRAAILALCLESDESLKIYRHGISVYLRPRPNRPLTEALNTLAKLANELPPDETKPLPLNDLPEQFRPLLPLIRKWGISDDPDRAELLEASSRRQLDALVRRVRPLFEAINEYLDGFADNVPASAAALGSLAEAVAEAELILKSRTR